MSIIATAPVLGGIDLSSADTVELPRLRITGLPVCPPWCVTSHDDADSVFHRGPTHTVHTQDGRLADGVDVSAERLDLAGEPAGDATVYVEGAQQTALSPAQAVELAQALLATAAQASNGAVRFVLVEQSTRAAR